MHKHVTTGSVCGLFALLWSSGAAAEAGRDCSAVFDAAHEEEQAGHLRSAASLYENCALDSCSAPTRHSCEAKLLRLELDVPSVVPLAKDASGEPLVDAEVTLDGALLTSRLDGRAYPVDPGVHELVFSVAGKTFGRVRVVIAQGQRNRELLMAIPAPSEPPHTAAPVVAQPSAAPEPVAPEQVEPHAVANARELPAAPFSAPAAATRSDSASGRSLAPYLLGGTALLGVGAYALLSTWARNDNAELKSCSPSCPKDSINHIRNLYIAADVSLGVGAAAAIGSIASFVFMGPSAQPESAPRRRYALSIQPGRSGALAVLRGAL